MMKRLCVAAAVSVALANPAWADSFALGLIDPSTTQPGVAYPNFEGKINDDFTFSIASANTVTFDFFAYDNDAALSQVNFELFDSSANSLFTWSTNPDHTSVIFSESLAAGAYSFTVYGDQPGVGFGVYDMTVSVPIPEPETYAMLLAGLGLLGVVARRRKQQQS
jgi:hypothetical protein